MNKPEEIYKLKQAALKEYKRMHLADKEIFKIMLLLMALGENMPENKYLEKPAPWWEKIWYFFAMRKKFTILHTDRPYTPRPLG